MISKRLQQIKEKLLIVLGICLTTSCVTLSGNCKCPWSWKSDPYAVDVKNKLFIGKDEIKFTDKKSEDLVCFTYDNISELEFNIERLKLGKNK